MSIKVELWGDYACFTRPEMKVERVSYDVMTPSAARGIIEAIYWHPGLKWVIDSIQVLNPIKFVAIKRNEVTDKISYKKALPEEKTRYLVTKDKVDQRTSLVLKDVRYIVTAHFEITNKANETDNAGKFQDIIKRRLEKGQCYHQPCFGTREFTANFKMFDGRKLSPDLSLQGTKDLGFMLFDLDYTDPENVQPMFFRACMIDGFIDLENCEVIK